MRGEPQLGAADGLDAAVLLHVLSAVEGGDFSVPMPLIVLTDVTMPVMDGALR